MGSSDSLVHTSVLYYRISDYGNAVVFARESDALRVDAIRKTIKTAKTWGEFRAVLPAGEWDSITYSLDLDEDPDEDSEDSFADDLPFNAERLPGFSDGDYPDWLMQRMLALLPEEVLDKYAEGQSFWRNPLVTGFARIRLNPFFIREVVLTLSISAEVSIILS